MKTSALAVGALVALAALLSVPATEARSFGTKFEPAVTAKGGLSGSRFRLDLRGKGGTGGKTLAPDIKLVSDIEIPSVDQIVKPKKLRCRAVKNRRGEWRVRGRDCKKMLPPKKLPEVRLELAECIVETDRLGNRYLIGDGCPNEPIEIPEDDPNTELPEIECLSLVETEVNGIPVWTWTADGCDEPFEVDLPDPEIPENFGNRCPEDYFHPSQFTEETKLAMPVHDEYGFPFPHPILTEPGVIHRDHDGSTAGDKLECESYDGWHLCYNGHAATDFMLAGHFLAMDNASVSARAAAAGRVMRVVDGNFDRCEADLDPSSDTFGEVICPNPEADDTSVNPANKVVLCHPDGTITKYVHLMNGTIEVVEGQSVSCGEPLGLIGSSGMSAAPHLHFEVRQKNTDGVFDDVDPYAENDVDSLWVNQNGGLPGTLPSAQCQ